MRPILSGEYNGEITKDPRMDQDRSEDNNSNLTHMMLKLNYAERLVCNTRTIERKII